MMIDQILTSKVFVCSVSCSCTASALHMCQTFSVHVVQVIRERNLVFTLNNEIIRSFNVSHFSRAVISSSHTSHTSSAKSFVC